MNDDQIRELCQKLKPVIGQRADALWISYVGSETPKAKLETEALLNMLALSPLLDLLAKSKKRLSCFDSAPVMGAVS